MSKSRTLIIKIDSDELKRICSNDLEIELVVTHANIKVRANTDGNKVEYSLEKK